MKILIYDVETSTLDLLIRTYDLKNRIKYFNHKDIVRDWTMLGAAWKFLDKDRVHCISVSPQDPLNDYEVIKKLHAALDSADVLVGHNSDNFDIKKFNTRALQYNLPPIQNKKKVDTLKMARKYFKFSSNTLRYIAKYLGVGEKGESPDWEKILAGDKKELAFMRKYNKQDVIVTENVYLRLREWHETHPDVSTVTRDIEGFPLDKCPRCDSAHVVKAGKEPVIKRGLISGFKQRFKCQDCKKQWVGNLLKS